MGQNCICDRQVWQYLSNKLNGKLFELFNIPKNFKFMDELFVLLMHTCLCYGGNIRKGEQCGRRMEIIKNL